MVVVELHPEHRVGEGLHDLSLHLDLLFLGQTAYNYRAAPGRYLPLKLAFPGPSARKVSTALCRSSVANRGAAMSPTRSSAPRTPCSRKARTIRLVAACALVGPAARRCANSIVWLSRSPSPMTLFTTFQRSSVAAGKRSPLITSSRARAGPARSATRWVPPIAGVRPTTISTSPKRADSAAQIKSQASAI